MFSAMWLGIAAGFLRNSRKSMSPFSEMIAVALRARVDHVQRPATRSSSPGSGNGEWEVGQRHVGGLCSGIRRPAVTPLGGRTTSPA